MQGMFGQDPAIIQQGLQQQQDQAMMQQAQLDPWSAVAYGTGSAAQRLGSGIGGMLGYEDPQMKQANTIKKIQEESLSEAKAMGIDPSKDMEKFAEIVAGKYTAAGMPDKAFGVHQMVQGIKAKQAETGLKLAQTQKEMGLADKAITEGKIATVKAPYEINKLSAEAGEHSNKAIKMQAETKKILEEADWVGALAKSQIAKESAQAMRDMQAGTEIKTPTTDKLIAMYTQKEAAGEATDKEIALKNQLLQYRSNFMNILAPGMIGSPTPVMPTTSVAPNKAAISISVKKGSTLSPDQERLMQEGIKALERAPSKKDEIIRRLKEKGIPVDEIN